MFRFFFFLNFVRLTNQQLLGPECEMLSPEVLGVSESGAFMVGCFFLHYKFQIHFPLMLRFRSYVAVGFAVKLKPFLGSLIGKLELYPKEEHDAELT